MASNRPAPCAATGTCCGSPAESAACGLQTAVRQLLHRSPAAAAATPPHGEASGDQEVPALAQAAAEALPHEEAPADPEAPAPAQVAAAQLRGDEAPADLEASALAQEESRLPFRREVGMVAV
uniref:Uncharacterized protein n=1 Tax=Alexandrium monilatum TaxID=311494 RepID=A0A7S4SIY3_9DINO